MDRRLGQDNVCKVVGNADDPLRLTLIARKELQEVLELTRVLLLEEPLRTASLARVPTKLRSSALAFRLLAGDQGVPCFVDERLTQKPVDHAGMHPLALGQARLEVSGNVLDVTLAGRVQGRAEAASPVLALAKKLDHLFGVWAGFASVALFVVLIKRIGTPEAAVAAGFRARVLPPTLVELVLVPLPVVLALEARLARCAPVNVGLVGGLKCAWIATTHETGAGGRRVGRKHWQRCLTPGAGGRCLPGHV